MDKIATVTGQIGVRPCRVGMVCEPGTASVISAANLAASVWGGMYFPLLTSGDEDASRRIARALGVDVLYAVDDTPGSKAMASQPGYARAQAVYVDCYEVLADTPRPVVETALNAGADLYLNLGGSSPPPWLGTAMAGRQARVIQTNADEDNLDAATRLLDELFELRAADIAVVTAGRDGAIARTRAGAVVSAPALAVTVRQVQGAGAVFSAAFVDALHQGMELQPSLRTACVAGSLWCERTTEAPFPDRMQLADRMSQ
jgi:hypothetical protein